MSRLPLIVILGPTASGKSSLAIRLAKKFGGEIVSADSRQVYKGLDLGSGKVSKKERKEIPHHLLDVASPKRRFTVAQYQKLALKAIEKIHRQKKVPFLAGGSGFYLQAVIDGLIIPKVRPDRRLREDLEKLKTSDLFQLLKKLDLRRARTIEKENRRRLIRALEIVIKTGKPVPLLKKQLPPFKILILGIKKSPSVLKKAIKKRLLKRLKQGMVAEVKRLRKSGLSWKRLEEFGLEYRYIAYYLQKKLKHSEMITQLEKAIWKFTQKQMRWFKRDPRTHWIENFREAERLVEKFLKKKNEE